MDQVWLDCLCDAMRFLAVAGNSSDPGSQAEAFLAFLVAKFAEIAPQLVYYDGKSAERSMAAFATQLPAALGASALRPDLENLIENEMMAWMEKQLNTSLENAELLFHTTTPFVGAPVTSLRLAILRALKAKLHMQESRSPVIYIPFDVGCHEYEEAAARTMHDMHLQGVVRRAPTLPNQESLDMPALTNMIAEDKKLGLLPCLIMARVATPVTGQRDSFEDLRSLCKTEVLWLHVDGATFHHFETWDSPLANIAATADSWFLGTSTNASVATLMPLAGMTIFTRKLNHSEKNPVETFNSEITMPIPVGAVVGPTGKVTITPRSTMPTTIAPSRVNGIETLFPAWVAKHTWDWNRAACDSKEATALTQTVLDTVREHTFLEQNWSSTLPAVLLRFASANSISTQTATLRMHLAIPDEIRELLNIDLVDAMDALYIRYRPYSSRLPIANHRAPLYTFLARVVTEAVRLASAERLQEELRTAVIAHREMTWIPIPIQSLTSGDEELDLWIPLGGVRYTPPYIDAQADNIAGEVVEDLDGLNGMLAGKVKVDGFECRSGVADEDSLPAALAGGGRDFVKIGLGTQYYDVLPKDAASVLVEHVTREAVKLERDSDFVARIANVIKRGIEQAEKQLQDESEEEYTNQPSILRMLPIVGSVLSWWRPEVPRNRVPVARTFSIATGFTTIPLDPALASPNHRPSISLPARSYASLVRTPEGTPSQLTDFQDETPPSEGAVQDKSYFDLRAAFDEPPSPVASIPTTENKHELVSHPGVVTEADQDAISDAPEGESRGEALDGGNRGEVLDGGNRSEAQEDENGGVAQIPDVPPAPPKMPAEPSAITSSAVSHNIEPPIAADLPPTPIPPPSQPPSSQPSSEALASGVRAIFQAYATTELNNKKIRILLQQRLGGVDLKSRVAEIRELVDRELNNRANETH
ncbi:Pyridoxal-dependent decarboxylase domain-containing protein 1 [Geranomyces michiganensis]|nr:Pyridoxal-dependent decarboxylase domain-containing protein 1 [Geranomyces michiganensis]